MVAQNYSTVQTASYSLESTVAWPRVAITPGERTTATGNVRRIHRSRPITVTGSTVFSATRHLALVTGLAGMARPRNSCASVDFCTTRGPDPAIGQRTSKDVRNIVSRWEVFTAGRKTSCKLLVRQTPRLPLYLCFFDVRSLFRKTRNILPEATFAIILTFESDHVRVYARVGMRRPWLFFSPRLV